MEDEKKLETISQQVQVIDLPVSAIEDRVVGSLDFEQAIKEGIRLFQPGIMAQANRGIIYVDEVNLLDDHIVDVLLDAASPTQFGLNSDNIGSPREADVDYRFLFSMPVGWTVMNLQKNP